MSELTWSGPPESPWQESWPPVSWPAHRNISGINSCLPARKNIILHRSLLTIGTWTSCNTDGSVPPSDNRPHPVTKRADRRISNHLADVISSSNYLSHFVRLEGRQFRVSKSEQCEVRIPAMNLIAPALNHIRTWKSYTWDGQPCAPQHAQRKGTLLECARNHIRRHEYEFVRSINWKEHKCQSIDVIRRIQHNLTRPRNGLLLQSSFRL